MLRAVHASKGSLRSAIQTLWAETRGDPAICIAVLDGPVDQTHPSLAAAAFTRLESLAPNAATQGPATRHGTHVASVLFGQDGIEGLAPQCRGLIVPIFEDGEHDTIAPCSQINLARAISQAAEAGAHLINISGGELTPSGTAHPLLARAVRDCARRGILIVAATGNDGCACLHVPGALPSVLAVGAMNARGEPLGFSNWGGVYQNQGLLAPGENIIGARPGGGRIAQSGTSYATPIVTGIAALLLSLQRKRGLQPDPYAVRAALLGSALGCDAQQAPDCRRLLAGRLNVQGALSQIIHGEKTMTTSLDTHENAQQHVTEAVDAAACAAMTPPTGVLAATHENGSIEPTAELLPPSVPSAPAPPALLAEQSTAAAGGVHASCGGNTSCSCGSAPSVQRVYALGQLGIDFGTETRRHSIAQHLGGNVHDPAHLLKYFDNNPWDAASIHWTLNLDATPIYAIQAQGPFARDVYERLRGFLREQLTEGVERVSVPGLAVGNVRLLSGQTVPALLPDLRGMYSWTTAALVEAVGGKAPAKDAKPQARSAYDEKTQAVANFLLRVYDELRNLGLTAPDRAINYVATNALLVAEVFHDALRNGMDLDTIETEPSPISHGNADCWDVRLTFFNPQKVFEQARKVYRFTVDVSDIVPVMVGSVRSWFVR